MKKTIILFTLLSALSFYGQHKVADQVLERVNRNVVFRHFSPFTIQHSIPKGIIAVKDATYASVNMEAVKEIAASGYENIEVTLPYNNSIITVQLYKVDIVAEGFHLDTDKVSFINYEKGAYYRGIIKGDASSVASFNFFRGEMNGVISGEDFNNVIVGRLQRKDNLSNYIIYSDTKLNAPVNFRCSAPEPTAGSKAHRGINTAMDTNSARCVTVYFEVDHDLFLANSADVVQTNNWMLSVFNNVQTLFANDGITTALKSVFIWTTPDPYVGENSLDFLMQFFEQRPVFDGDVGQLVAMEPGGLGGIAIDIAGLCTDNNVSFADVYPEFEQVPVYSATVLVITHELGHLMGSPHTHGCYWNGNNTAIDGCGTTAGYVEGECPVGPIPDPEVGGTIMSYCHLFPNVGINFANGFGLQPRERILNHVNSSLCLSTDCTNTCINGIATITTTSPDENTIVASWTDMFGNGPWEVSIAPYSGSFTSWQTVTTTTITFSTLDPNTYYKVAVRPVCPNTAQVSARSEIIGATFGDYCGGLTFTDTGGILGDYGNNERLVRTITPNVPGTKAIVTFSMLQLEEDFDFLYVYNGPDSNAPLIGAFTGETVPGPFYSTAPDGSLTFEFISDQFLTMEGWAATVSCAALSTPSITFADFNYFPNPAKNIVNISAGEALGELYVYNVAGQLHMHSTNNDSEIAVDIASFADGVYFFRVNSGAKEINFRIIKQN